MAAGSPQIPQVPRTRKPEIDAPPRLDLLRRTSSTMLALTLFGALSPLLFLLVGILAGRLDGEKESKMGKRVQSAILLVPSLFPIVFAALTAHTLRAIAVKLAERGTTIGRLEQLLGSFTLGSTLVTHILLRMFTVSGIAVICLWMLSPVGGQAAVRMLRTGKMVTERVPTTIWYRSSDTVTAFSDGAGAKTAAANMNAQYMSAILSPLSMREDGQDIYGNIKVPVLEKLNQSMVDDDGWIAVGGGPVEYAGLLGVPTAGLTDSGIMNYMIETSYFVLECDKPMTITMDEAKEEKYGRVGNQLTQLRPFTMSLNLTAEDRARAGSNTIRKEESPSAGNLVFASIGAQIYTSGGIPPIIWIGCKLRMAHVESIVHCEGKVCGVISMRKSLLVQAPANLTPFDGMGLQVPVLFLSNFIAASGELHQSDSSTATEQFLFDPNAVFNDTANSRVDLEAVSLEDFTTRLSLLFNTYWSASLAPYSFQSVSGNLSALDPLPDVPFLFGRIGDPAIPQNRDAPFLARKSNTILSLYGERYICNWRWLLLYMFSSCVLLGVALLGVVVQRLTIAPDIFGYASSFTRDNPYTDLPPEADICTLDGVQRARILRDLSVRLADVKPGEKVGHVAFVTSGVKESGELSPGAARVRTGRSYY